MLCIIIFFITFLSFNKVSYPLDKKTAINIAVDYLKKVDNNPYVKVEDCTAVIEREDSWIIKISIPDKEDVARSNKDFLVVVDKNNGEVIVGPYK